MTRIKYLFLIVNVVFITSFVSAQRYNFDYAVRKTQYGNNVKTYIASGELFQFRGAIILDLNKKILNEDGSPYTIYGHKKEFLKNGDTRIIVQLMYRGRSDDKYVGVFVLKNEGYISTFTITGEGRKIDYYIELKQYSK